MSTSTSGIEWTDRTWNPTRGCRRVSPGCENCYAERQAGRWQGRGQPYEGLVRIGPQGARWTGKTRLVEEVLREPLSWKTPRSVFVNSMSDLFYEGFSNEEIAAVFGIMAACRAHAFQVLTKNAKRMADWFAWIHKLARPDEDDFKATRRLSIQAMECMNSAERILGLGTVGGMVDPIVPWPLPNVWLGVSVEDQPRAEERLPHLLKVPAALRFVSYEPALGPVDWRPWLSRWRRTCDRADVTDVRVPGVDWLIVGGESGGLWEARDFELSWARDALAACKAAGVPCFVKQLGRRAVNGRHPEPPRPGWSNQIPVLLRHPKGGDPAEWPEDLRVREMPR